MKTLLHITFELILICGLNAQEPINNPVLIKSNGIKICKVYSIESTKSDTLIQDGHFISFIQEYDSEGRLIEHKELNYDNKSGSLKANITYKIDYDNKKTITTRIDSIRDNKETKISEVNDSLHFESTETILNDEFKSKYIVYYDKTGKKLKREGYNEDGSMKFSYNYDYIIDSLDNTERMYVKGKIKEKIQTVYNNSKIFTTYTNDEKIKDVVYENYLFNGKQKSFCQIIYSDFDSAFDFYCVEFFYDSANRLKRIEYPQTGRFEVFEYNDLGLLNKHKNIDSEGYMTFTIYTYE